MDSQQDACSNEARNGDIEPMSNSSEMNLPPLQPRVEGPIVDPVAEEYSVQPGPAASEADSSDLAPHSHSIPMPLATEAASVPVELDESQFSLRSLLILITLFSLLFAGMGQLPRPLFAGLAGGASLAVLILHGVLGSRHVLLRWGWWLLFATYLVASLMAGLGM